MREISHFDAGIARGKSMARRDIIADDADLFGMTVGQA